MSEIPSSEPVADVQEVRRRRFVVEAAAFVIGGIATLIPGAAAVAYFLTPIFKKKGASGADDGFTMVGTAQNLKPGGPPQFFKVMGVKHDAWTTYPSTSLGAVYVRRDDEGKLHCLNARCPHLGCTVQYQASETDFMCPCHASSFSLDGQRSNQIPPRNLDELEVEIRNDNEVWVKFQNFRAGREAKIPV